MWFATNYSPVQQQIALYLHAVLAVIAADCCLMETQVAFSAIWRPVGPIKQKEQSLFRLGSTTVMNNQILSGTDKV